MIEDPVAGTLVDTRFAKACLERYLHCGNIRVLLRKVDKAIDLMPRRERQWPVTFRVWGLNF